MGNRPIKHTLSESIILHLLPGLLGGSFYFLLIPLVKAHGFPSLMALSLSGIFILIPFEAGFLLYQKQKSGNTKFNELITYRKPLKIWQYIIWIFIIILLSGMTFKTFNFVSESSKTFFFWMPSNSILDMGLSNEYLKSKLIITYAFFLIFIVLVLPTIEELYFRGYLLPRMPLGLKGWSELIHSALFSLYHVWTPWMFITRTLSVLPLVYIVKRKENIYIGIISHCLLNSIDLIIGLVFIMNL